jgi:hypothetical protein
LTSLRNLLGASGPGACPYILGLAVFLLDWRAWVVALRRDSGMDAPFVPALCGQRPLVDLCSDQLPHKR